MTIIATALALLVPAQAEPAPTVPHWRRLDCHGWHREQVARRWLRGHVRSERAYLDEPRVRRVRRCVPTRAGALRLRRDVRRWRKWRLTYAHRWPVRFNRLPQAWQNWAYATGACESGNNPGTYTGNGFSGAFQFLPSTWWAAGGQGYPHQHSWHYQAVIAVHWRMRSSQSQWPNCAPW